MKWLDRSLHRLQKLVNWPYYFLLIAILAAIDVVLIVVPIDGLVITAAYTARKSWARLALGAAIGSTIGSALLAWGVSEYGMTLVNQLLPGLENNPVWPKAVSLINNYGDFAVFLTGIAPVIQQPTVVIAALGKMPLFKIVGWLLLGRLIKYFLISAVAAKAPHLISKLRGVKKELDEAKRTIE